jgi:hypothetical protein
LKNVRRCGCRVDLKETQKIKILKEGERGREGERERGRGEERERGCLSYNAGD